MLGASLAWLYVPARVVAPSAYAMAAMRTNPVTRDSAVPTATTALERTSDVSTSEGLDPGSLRPISSGSGPARLTRRSCVLPGRRRDRARGRGRAIRALAAAAADVPAPPDRE